MTVICWRHRGAGNERNGEHVDGEICNAGWVRKRLLCVVDWSQTSMTGWKIQNERVWKIRKGRWGHWSKGIKMSDNVKQTDGEFKCERRGRPCGQKKGAEANNEGGSEGGFPHGGGGKSPSAWCFQNITWRLPCVGNYCRLTITPKNRSEKICLQFMKCVPGLG